MREEAKRRAELYQALADGKTLQVYSGNGFMDIAEDVLIMQIDSAIRNKVDLRIKPEPKKAWYRVAKFKDGRVWLATSLDPYDKEIDWEKDSNFICWLTDRIEYELPEGE